MKKFVLFLTMVILGLSNVMFGQGTWTLQTNPTTSPGVSMQFVSVTEGWIVLDNNQLLHTTNSGTNWNIVTPSTTDIIWGPDAPGSRISFINSTTGWVLKTFGNIDATPLGAVLYKTTNGGATWSRNVLSNTLGDLGVQVQFVDASTGWILLYNMNTGTPTFLKTTDGGTTWVPTNGGGVFSYLNANTGYSFSAGPNLPPPYSISKTTDGGATWAPLYTDNTLGELKAIQFTDLNTGWVVGDNGKILKTTNGGINWIPIVTAGINANFKIHSLNFVDNNIGFISVRDNTLSNNPEIMLHTTNGGNTWTQQILPFDAKLYSAFFWDANNGWATSDWNNSTNPQIARYSSGLAVDNSALKNQGLTVYPNPNSGIFTLKSETLKFPISIEIFDISGKNVFEKKAVTATPYQVEFKPQNTGLYFLKVNDGNKTFTEKLIVK